LLIENCEIEAPGDDSLNVGTLMERIVEVSKEDPKVMTLSTTDNRYCYYTIREGDRLQFLDTKTAREVGIATVEKVESNPQRRSHRIVIDRELPKFDPATILVLNLNQMTSSTVIRTAIRNNVMRPVMRNAMLVRAQHMIIEGNSLDGSRGGVIGLNFTSSMGESARLRGISITRNLIASFQHAGIVFINAYRNWQRALDTRDVAITGSVLQAGPTRIIRIRGVQKLHIEGNRFEKNGKAVQHPSKLVEISDCVNLQMNDE
jgi:hypothetical protein